MVCKTLPRRHTWLTYNAAGLTYDTPTTYQNYTDYMSSDQAKADDLWASIDTSPMVVALRDDWAVEHDLPLSIFRFPWDQDSKGLYYLKVYHGLHCLVCPSCRYPFLSRLNICTEDHAKSIHGL